jgi:branched-chain amino acid aminotransferase
MSDIVYKNGMLLPLSEANVSVLDYGLLYGYGLFETMRAYDGRVFRIDRHLRRLERLAGVLGISVDIRVLKDAVMETIRANKLKDARIRATVTIGEGEMTPSPDTCEKPTVIVLAAPYRAYPKAVYQKGFRAIVSSIRRNSQSPLSGIKSSNYLESILARQEAKTAGVDEAIFLNEKGLLAEASMSNIFIVAGETLKTPDRESGILPGITRETVLEITAKLGLKVIEQKVTLNELVNAQEAFLTNSLIEIMPLVEVEKKKIGSGRPGDITGKLIDSYRELVKKNEQ